MVHNEIYIITYSNFSYYYFILNTFLKIKINFLQKKIVFLFSFSYAFLLYY
jgi:hypothetical protein